MIDDWSELTMYSPVFTLGWTREEYWDNHENNEKYWEEKKGQLSDYNGYIEADIMLDEMGFNNLVPLVATSNVKIVKSSIVQIKTINGNIASIAFLDKYGRCIANFGKLSIDYNLTKHFEA